MTATLRPMSLGEILDRAFQIYRAYFLPFLGLALLPLTAQMTLHLLGLVFDVLVRQTTLSVSVQRDLSGSYKWIATGFSSDYLTFVMWPVFCAAAAQILLRGEFGIVDTLKSFHPRWRALLTIAGIFWVLESAVPRLLHGAHSLGVAWRTMPLWISFIMSPIEAFALTAPLVLGLPIWTIERREVPAAFSRSWTLSKGAYRRMFVTYLLQSMAIWIMAMSIRVTLSLAYYLIPRQDLSSWIYSVWIVLPTWVASVAAGPLLPIAITLIYYDQRIRLEGFDIELMMDVAGMSSPAPAQAPPIPIASSPSEEAQG